MVHYNIIFITTFINLNKIEILLRSLKYNYTLRLKIILVAQNGLRIEIDRYNDAYNDFSIIEHSIQLNSSEARNIGIDYVISNNIQADYIMFPDDDSSFDRTFFEYFADETKGKQPMIISVYNEGSWVKYIKHSLTHGMRLSKKHYYAVGSTNMIVPYDLLMKTGNFDELMGVGAQYGAGEDGDFYIRAVQAGGEFVYNSKLYTFHPKANDKYRELTHQQLLSRYKNYGIGVAYLYFKHGMHFHSFMLCTKSLIALFIYLVKFDFKMVNIYCRVFIYRVQTVMRFAQFKK